ncbi:PGF-CTERM sorting domain-containing protein [Halolamina rubra]|uniref:PGF-CTERM sorting domain-containing protein n=1 Tax=Halolamina rubra TaxID=1380430 RepID=UPI000679AAF5|nr:PGF-CTERM sorting domain-containing protein [Halolamina rubra]
MNATVRTLALVALVAVGAFTGAAAAASNGSVQASPTSPGQTSTHTATLTAGDDAAGSLNGFEVDYSDSGVDVSNVGTGDVVAVGIDVDDDSDGKTVDKNVSDDLSSVDSSNNGETVTFTFGGSYDVDAGDEIVVVFENAQNADAGEYDVGLDINPQSSGGEGTATLSLGDNDRSSTETATEWPAGDDTQTASTDEGTTDGTDDDESGASAPGFGAALTVLALVGAAFVAARRRGS